MDTLPPLEHSRPTEAEVDALARLAPLAANNPTVRAGLMLHHRGMMLVTALAEVVVELANQNASLLKMEIARLERSTEAPKWDKSMLTRIQPETLRAAMNLPPTDKTERAEECSADAAIVQYDRNVVEELKR